MIDSLVGISPHMCRRLAEALESGLLTPPYTPAGLRSSVGTADESVLRVLREWERLAVSSRAAATWLRSLIQVTATAAPNVFVWSGPEAKGLHSRDTRQVYGELIASAKKSILISTYAYFDGRKRFRRVADRLESDPGLDVTLLLNIERGSHSTTRASDLVLRFAENFWESDWPGRTRPNVYYDPRSLSLDGSRAVLHAKVVIADEESLFVTSANLTQAAFDRNIEAGVLLRDRAMAVTANQHFRRLIDQSILLPLPRL